jgi:hypothetical protein
MAIAADPDATPLPITGDHFDVLAAGLALAEARLRDHAELLDRVAKSDLARYREAGPDELILLRHALEMEAMLARQLAAWLPAILRHRGPPRGLIEAWWARLAVRRAVLLYKAFLAARDRSIKLRVMAHHATRELPIWPLRGGGDLFPPGWDPREGGLADGKLL